MLGREKNVFSCSSFTIICHSLKFKQHIGENFKNMNIRNRSKIPHFTSNSNALQGNKKQVPFHIDPSHFYFCCSIRILLVCILDNRDGGSRLEHSSNMQKVGLSSRCRKSNFAALHREWWLFLYDWKIVEWDKIKQLKHTQIIQCIRI